MTNSSPSMSGLVVLLDGSTSDAERQLPWALLLARSWQVPLTLLHVVDPAQTSEPVEVARAFAGDYLELVAANLRREPQAPAVSIEVRDGLIDEEWHDFGAAHSGSVLMLPSTQGRGGLSLFRTRSMEQTIQAFTTPVIVVPERAEPPSGIERAVVGVDGSAFTAAILESAQEGAMGRGMEVVAVEVIEQGSAPDHELLQRQPAITGAKVALRGRPGPTILAVARHRKAQVIVVGAHRRGRGILDMLVGSTSLWLARNSDRPVVIIPHAWLDGSLG